MHRVRRRIAELRRAGFVELSRLLADWHIAELMRPVDGAAVTVARGAAGDALFLSDRPLWAARQLSFLEVLQ